MENSIQFQAKRCKLAAELRDLPKNQISAVVSCHIPRVTPPSTVTQVPVM
jgi:hypothetical protein